MNFTPSLAANAPGKADRHIDLCPVTRTLPDHGNTQQAVSIAPIKEFQNRGPRTLLLTPNMSKFASEEEINDKSSSFDLLSPLLRMAVCRNSMVKLMLFLMTILTAGFSHAQTYTSNPAIGTDKNVGVGFRFRVQSISGSNITFAVYPKTGTFGQSGTAVIKKISTTGTVVGTGSTYSAGASTAGTITVNMATAGLTTGSMNFYAVKQTDSNVWDGPITITATSPLTATLSNITTSPTSGLVGTSMSWTYTINVNQSGGVLLGAALQSSGGTNYDLGTGFVKTLSTGTNTYTITANVPSNVPAGVYSLRGAVWKDVDGNGSIGKVTHSYLERLITTLSP